MGMLRVTSKIPFAGSIGPPVMLVRVNMRDNLSQQFPIAVSGFMGCSCFRINGANGPFRGDAELLFTVFSLSRARPVVASVASTSPKAVSIPPSIASEGMRSPAPNREKNQALIPCVGTCAHLTGLLSQPVRPYKSAFASLRSSSVMLSDVTAAVR